jgi:hypothetical protein
MDNWQTSSCHVWLVIRLELHMYYILNVVIQFLILTFKLLV